MGCSSSSPEDANALLEKQRQMMLKRQLEFEQKRAQQDAAARPATAAAATATTAAPRKPSKDSATPSREASSAHNMAKEADNVARASAEGAATTPASIATSEPSTPKPPSAQNSSNAVDAPAAVLDDDGTLITAEVRRKYTIDPAEDEKRKSKNLHDYKMYGKSDFARRASLNPQTIVVLDEATVDAAATAIEEEAAGTARWTVVGSAGPNHAAAAAAVAAAAPTAVLAPPDVVDEPVASSDDAPATEATVDDAAAVGGDAQPSSEDVDKHTVRNADDRKSKNIHDYSLCAFSLRSRRACACVRACG